MDRSFNVVLETRNLLFVSFRWIIHNYYRSYLKAFWRRPTSRLWMAKKADNIFPTGTAKNQTTRKKQCHKRVCALIIFTMLQIFCVHHLEFVFGIISVEVLVFFSALKLLLFVPQYNFCICEGSKKREWTKASKFESGRADAAFASAKIQNLFLVWQYQTSH